MKVIIFLLSAIFMLSACGKKQVKSSLEENTTLSDNIVSLSNTEDLVEPAKHFLTVVVKEGIPNCKMSLDGRSDLVPSFVDIYPEGDSVYSKSLVSLESAKQMTEEQREDAIVVPDDIVSLPDCSVEEEADVAQMAPDMMLIDGTEEEVASLLASLAIRSAMACVAGAGTGWGIKDNQEGFSLSNITAMTLGPVTGTLLLIFTFDATIDLGMRRLPGIALSLGVPIVCGVGSYFLLGTE